MALEIRGAPAYDRSNARTKNTKGGDHGADHRGSRRFQHRQVHAGRPDVRARGPAAARRRRRASSGSASFTHLGESWQAIDTPGSIEFLHVATDALLAADAAVICVGPDPAAAVLASPYLHAVEAAGTPAVLFVNRIDEATGAGPRHRRGAAGLRRCIRSSCARSRSAMATTSPAPSTSSPSGPGPTARASRRQLIEIPAGLLEREHEARGELLEHLSEFDDHLLEELIEDREPPSDEVYAICARVLGENRVHRGADRLRRPRQRHRPGDEGAPPRGARRRRRCASGCRRRPASARRRSAVVFASAYRKHVGKTLLLRALDAARRRPAARRPRRRASSPRPTRATAATSTRCPRATIVSAVKADHLAAGTLATAGDAARRRRPGTGRSRRSCSRILAPTLRARQRQALRRAGLARRGRRRADRDARTRPPAARSSASRARCTCACCASG